MGYISPSVTYIPIKRPRRGKYIKSDMSVLAGIRSPEGGGKDIWALLVGCLAKRSQIDSEAIKSRAVY